MAVEGCTGLCCQFSQVLSSSSCEIVMSDCTEQRICLRFCFCLGKTATEAHEMLQKAFKVDALSRTQVLEWFARFKRGEMSVEDILILGACQQVVPTRISKKLEKKSTRIVGTQLKRSQKLQV